MCCLPFARRSAALINQATDGPLSNTLPLAITNWTMSASFFLLLKMQHSLPLSQTSHNKNIKYEQDEMIPT